MNDQESHDRSIPVNDLDMNMMLTTPEWGREITQELRVKLQKVLGKDKGGKLVTEDLWALHAYYNKEMRLGNLKNIEVDYCRIYLDIAGDGLREGYILSFTTALSRVATVLELSQSRGGFLRKRLSTITTEDKKFTEEDKRGMFGNKKQEEEMR